MIENVLNDTTRASATRMHAQAWQVFLILVSAATLLPFVIAPVVSQLAPEGSSAFYVYALINFFGSNFHVAATGWFFTDPEMRSHFRSRPLRYFVVPLLLVAGSTAAFCFLDRALTIWLLVAFLAWQLWHYQKQNVGLLSFVAAGTGGTPLSVWERRTFALAAVAGILGFFGVARLAPSGFTAEMALLHQAGGIIYCLVPVLFCVALVKVADLRRNTLRLLFFAFGALFFLPTYLFSDMVSALVGYAIAHGLQYIVFMGVVSVRRRNAAISLVKLLLIATAGAVLLDNAREGMEWLDQPFGAAVYGAFLGVVMAHFVLDAGIWRLREAFQRSYMRRRFFFVFDR
jgi:hypothetical protein